MMRNLETILVAVDFFAPSQPALDAAIALAGREGAKLHIVHSVESPTFATAPFALPTAYVATARQEAQQLLEKAVKRAAERGVDAEGHLSSSPASTAIDALAAELDADLLVVGTHGHTGLKHFTLGSVAERVLRGAPCSVLVVK